jgi:hypothetical protein
VVVWGFCSGFGFKFKNLPPHRVSSFFPNDSFDLKWTLTPSKIVKNWRRRHFLWYLLAWVWLVPILHRSNSREPRDPRPSSRLVHDNHPEPPRMVPEGVPREPLRIDATAGFPEGMDIGWWVWPPEMGLLQPMWWTFDDLWLWHFSFRRICCRLFSKANPLFQVWKRAIETHMEENNRMKHSVLGSHAAHAYFMKPSSRWWGLNGTHFHQLQRTQSEISDLTTSNKSHLPGVGSCTMHRKNIQYYRVASHSVNHGASENLPFAPRNWGQGLLVWSRTSSRNSRNWSTSSVALDWKPIWSGKNPWCVHLRAKKGMYGANMQRQPNKNK